MHTERAGDVYVRHDLEDQADLIDRALDGIERAAQIDAANNYRILDNHLMHSDRVIAAQAAMEATSNSLWDRMMAMLPFLTNRSGES